MADNIINNKTFSSAVNTIADLDSTYARELFVSKNNVQLNTQTYTMKAYITTYNTSTMVLETKLIIERSVVGNAQIKSSLDDICSGIHSLYSSITATNTVTANGADFDIQIDIVSPSILVSDVNVQFIIGGFAKYDIHSGSENYIKILPFLTSIGPSAISDMKTISPYALDISAIAPYACHIAPVYSNICNIECVSLNINNVNTVSSSISNINALSPHVNSICELAKNTDTIIALSPSTCALCTIASNISNIVTLAGRVDEITIAKDNINEINVVANCVYPYINNILCANYYADCAKSYMNLASLSDEASYHNACLSKDYATKLCGEVEPGLYSSRYYACEAKNYNSSPSQILSAIKQVDGAGSDLDADKLHGYVPCIYSNLNNICHIVVSDKGTICTNYLNVNCSMYINGRFNIGGWTTESVSYGNGGDGSPYMCGTFYDGNYVMEEVDFVFGLYKRARNDTASTISKLRLVKINNTSSVVCRNPSVVYLVGCDTAHHDVYGLTTRDATCNSSFSVIRHGRLMNLDIPAYASSIGETWTKGDKLYMKPGTQTGEITKVEPLSNQIKIFVGTIINNTAIEVQIENINKNELNMLGSTITPSSIGAYTKNEIDNSYGTIADFEGALL